MTKILLLIFLSFYFTSAQLTSQLTSDSGLAFEVVAAEAQDAKANVTESDQEVTNATHPPHPHTHSSDETMKEHGHNEPKLLKVRATVEEEQKRLNETAKDADRHPKELKLQKEGKPETTTTAEADTTTTTTTATNTSTTKAP